MKFKNIVEKKKVIFSKQENKIAKTDLMDWLLVFAFSQHKEVAKVWKVNICDKCEMENQIKRRVISANRNYCLIIEMVLVEKKSYDWFEQRRKTRGLELAHDQITKAFDTVTWLHKATKSFSEKNFKETRKYIENLYKAEEEVDTLRTDVFMELSKGAALVSDYREDLLHLVKRLDTLADHTKDAARCLEMLGEADIPNELTEKTVFMTSKLVETAQTLRGSIEKISFNPNEAIKEAKAVGDIEHAIDTEYLKSKSLFVKYGATINCGAMVIFDDLIEFIEQAADMCADTADYIIVLSSRE